MDIRSQACVAGLKLFPILFLFLLSGCRAPRPHEFRGPAMPQLGPTTSLQDAVDALRANARGELSINHRLDTETPNFIRVVGEGDLLPGIGAVPPEDKANLFFAQFGRILGVTNLDNLELVAQQTDFVGVNSLTYRQVYSDVEVFGGGFTVHLDAQNDLTSVDGTMIVIEQAIDPIPTLRADVAAQIAVDAIRQQLGEDAAASELTALANSLYIYPAGIFEGVDGPEYLVYEIEVVNAERSVREFVYLDAHTGAIVDQITGILDIQRRIYDRRFLPAFLLWQETNNLPDDPDVANLISAAEDIYNLFATLTGGRFLSWDNADGTMHSVHNASIFSCLTEPNAVWNGAYTAFCPQLTSDDVVAHEWTHAYSQSTHDLKYAFQSGALNESYSDIFGEIVDQLNGVGTDTPNTARTAGSCSTFGEGSPSIDTSVRWLVGEDSAATNGALRDMWNPTCYGHPAKVTDWLYHCGALDQRRFDNGGVHTNSGVPNHAFALLVDGGTYNGIDVRGIGITKAAHIYWRAANRQTSTTDFPTHAETLLASCDELAQAGVDLPGLSVDTTVPFSSTEVMTADDCTQVENAVNAVELRLYPTQCPFVLADNPPPLCAAGESVSSIALQEWETGIDPWVTSARSIADPMTFGPPNWQVVSQLPDNRTGTAMFAADPTGICGTDNGTGVVVLESPAIEIPLTAIEPRVAFTHWIASEFGYDGGNVKVSVNGGAWENPPATAFRFNGYNKTLFPFQSPDLSQRSTNPLAGENAFTGASVHAEGGKWGQTLMTLDGIAMPGDSLRIRFEFGSDECQGVEGWYVDDVNVYACHAEETPAACGDAVLQSTEQCDDGNIAAGDGCSSTCQVEEGWTCTEPGPTAPGTNIVQDGSFEAGPSTISWAQVHGVFGSPICSVATCGGAQPADGQYHLWFGGVRTPDHAGVQQQVTIPPSATTLTFDLYTNACDSGEDQLTLSIDDQQVFSTGTCTPATAYATRQVDIAPFADGNEHTLRISGQVHATNGGVSNFFVDRIHISDNVATPSGPSVCTDN